MNSSSLSRIKHIGHKSVFNLVHRLSRWHCPHLLLSSVLQRSCCWASASAAVYQYFLAAGRSAANPPLLLSIDGTYGRTDGQTDVQPFHRPSFAYCQLCDGENQEAWCMSQSSPRLLRFSLNFRKIRNWFNFIVMIGLSRQEKNVVTASH